ncbi:hypothetical protein FHX08_000005 [Rhizobium sp. BK529]|uniref:hypothetical protein n=1 Tax=unclassified Rhizobium TaxID=2613769 RepID=UPI0014055BAA|nr:MULTISPECIES: hypothetical protein [unclassified Rhizobium]MBB3589661.1 hypothetical protein [Rhizobium sp. BK529]
MAKWSTVTTPTEAVAFPDFLSGIYVYCLSILSTVCTYYQNNRNNEEVACD